jgi:hypothetical protein
LTSFKSMELQLMTLKSWLLLVSTQLKVWHMRLHVS